MSKPAVVYILADENRTVYIDVTKDLDVSVLQAEQNSGLRLRVVALEEFSTIKEALDREETLKAAGEAEILLLVNAKNPSWQDLLRRPVPYGVAGPDQENGEGGGVGAKTPNGPAPRLVGGAAKTIP